MKNDKPGKQSNTFKQGILDGIPIALGYLSVSFSFGILAVTSGLDLWQAVLVSLFNLTSAGQVAGLSIMTASGGLVEMAVSQLVINLRYGLMAISLSQKTDKSVTVPSRFLLAYGITDEIFGVASGVDHPIGRRYQLGLMILPIVGWTLGTFIGAAAGAIFPEYLSNALAIGIYGMFISIVVPKAKHSRSILICVMISLVISTLFYFEPHLSSSVSGGFATIIAAVIAAAIGASFFPSDKEEEAS